MAFQDVILTQKIEKLGAESDIVRVRAGYARNFLIPSGKAMEKTAGNLARLNRLKSKRAEREAQELNDAQEIARKINKLKLNFELETGESGKAFGSITTTDIADKIKAEIGKEVDRHTIELEKPIKSTGSFDVEVKLHHDVTAKLVINVKAKGGEAKAEEAADEPKGKGKSRK
ncbi:MAG TPA: 50S ribosomal protein L9 [Chthoniobacteraceae bacterium]|nr:50S ribosomal protein L9 [Chthoniobacteraceae bacterium]